MDNCFQSLHRKEKDLLLSIIKAKSVSRTTLQKESDLKVANFYNTVDSLLSYGLIEKTEDTQHQSKGRPSEFLSLNPDAYNTLYILLSRSKCHLAVSNLVGDLYEEEEYLVSFSITVDDFISSVKEYYLKKKDNYKIAFITFVTGINRKKRRDHRLDVSFYTRNVEEELSKTLDLPIFFDSIARAAALGIYNEKYSSEHLSLVFCNLSTGIGVGMVHDLIPEEFWYNNRISIEHWTVDPNGRECVCGEKGCLLSYLGSRNIVDNINQAKNEKKISDIKEAIEASNNGDKDAMDIMKEAAVAFSRAIKQLYGVLHFDVAAIGGSTCENNEYFRSQVEENLKDMPFILDYEQNYIGKTSKGICYRLLLELLT